MLRSSWIQGLCLVATLMLLSGCWTRSHRVQAPSALSFAGLDPVLLQGIDVTVRPTYVGDAATFSVTPSLPAGLALDPTNGEIFGIPAFITPTGTYTIIAENVAGRTEIVLTLTVNPQAPCGLTYFEESVKYIGEITVVSNPPSFGCGPVDTWTITPALPAGLSLDPVTGEISGIATEVIPPTDFLITASNVTGMDAREITIEVETPAPCGLSYAENDLVYPPTVAIPMNQPTSACGAVDIFTIDPPLPAGLSLDPVTGEITGAPTVETGEITYTITASNAYGDDSTDVRIRVAPVFEYIAEHVDAEYDPTDGSGVFTTRLMVEEGSANATFPTPVIGFSMALENDPTHVTPLSAVPGPDLMALNGGAGPDFFEPLLSPNAVTVGIVFSLNLTELIVADVPREIVLVDYETSQSWLIGNTDGAETTLTWGNPNPLPPITNEVGLSGTYSVDPVKNDSTVSLTPAAPAVP